MPRTRPVLSNYETDLILDTRSYMNFLLMENMPIGFMSSIQERVLREYQKHLLKITLKNIQKNPDFYRDETKLNKRFFRILDAHLEEIQESKSPVLRTVNWRARNVRLYLKGLSEMFQAAG